MTEVLTIYVSINGFTEVKGCRGQAAMLLFDGQAKSEYFQGRVCPGGVDTQKQADGPRSISARYILEGLDYTGSECKIFIENNALVDNEEVETHPEIFTDSPALSFLETGALRGTLTPREGGVTVHIFCAEAPLPRADRERT